MAYRVNRLDKVTGTRWEPALNYTVLVTEVGAVAASSSSGTDITVDAGHGFAAGDKFLKNPGSDNTFSGADTVQSLPDATTIRMGQNHSISAGDVLINLAADTGTATPRYDAVGSTIYSDMDIGTTIASSLITVGSVNADYEYWYSSGSSLWELYRGSDGIPVGHSKEPAESPLTEVSRDTSLPTVGTTSRLFVLNQGASSPDIVYVAVQFSDDTWDWLEIGRAT
jgi:hypothetical protein